jgi:hypothetical protein
MNCRELTACCRWVSIAKLTLEIEIQGFTLQAKTAQREYVELSANRLESVPHSCSPSFVNAAHVNGTHFMVLPSFQSMD